MICMICRMGCSIGISGVAKLAYRIRLSLLGVKYVLYKPFIAIHKTFTCLIELAYRMLR
jgi:hypothetical protein